MLLRATIFILAQIGQRRHKLPEQAIWPGVKLDAVQPTRHRIARRLRKTLNHRLNILVLHLLRHFAAIHFRHRRRPPQRRLRVMARALHATVIQLRQHQRAVRTKRL